MAHAVGFPQAAAFRLRSHYDALRRYISEHIPGRSLPLAMHPSWLQGRESNSRYRVMSPGWGHSSYPASSLPDMHDIIHNAHQKGEDHKNSKHGFLPVLGAPSRSRTGFSGFSGQRYAPHQLKRHINGWGGRNRTPGARKGAWVTAKWLYQRRLHPNIWWVAGESNPEPSA